MSSQTTPSVTPLSKFSRMGFGFGLVSKLNSRSLEPKKKTVDDEDWYIPYNGPYELPKELPHRQKARDSWGDPVAGEYDDEDAMLDDKEIHKRYGGHKDFSAWNTTKFPDEERKSRSRDRTFSLMSGRTVSSGALDPTRASLVTQRRSTVSAGNRPPVPSYINLDAVGGVGESPMPQIDTAKDHTAGRISLASIFSFGSTGRKTPTSPTFSADRVQQKLIARKVTRSSRSKAVGVAEKPAKLGSPIRHSTSSEFNRVSSEKAPPPLTNATVDNTDYYDSYYGTLIKSPTQEDTPQPQSHGFSSEQADYPSSNPPSSQGDSASSNSLHPYAYTFPQIPDPPRSAPPPTPVTHHDPYSHFNQQRYPDPPRLTFLTSIEDQSNPDIMHFPSSRPTGGGGLKQLKSFASTPDLRSTTARLKADPASTYTPPKGIDRWLSAETWCDALLFPRPRLRMKEDLDGSSGRIVSPPGSPLMQEFGGRPSSPGVVVSRVLAHSRSLVDLKANQNSNGGVQPVASTSKVKAHQPDASTSQEIRPHRPKSFAQDDLALLGPIFSLEQVIEEGEQLEYQRKQWQVQATTSLGNKRARSLSRTRSKSLTQRGGRGGHQHQNSIDYLASRACLGNQDLPPIIHASALRQQTPSFSDATGTITTTSGRPSHSHSNSLAKTMSKSSKTHSRGHSRSESWSKSAMKIAKSTAVICGFPVEGQISHAELNDKASSLEGALRREDTRVIRFPDPAQIPVDRSLGHLGGNTPRVSPTPSGVSDIRLGIAISTPPLTDDSLDRESIRMPAHPYAQGGLYAVKSNQNSASNEVRQDRGSDYAGPHPSTVVSTKLPDVSPALARHKLPPHIALHPYAQVSAAQDSGERLIAHARSDSDVAPPAKMWVQLTPGVIREILPSDLKYSPFLFDKEVGSGSDSPDFINDSVGLGDVLAYASLRDSRDSGVGTSEGHIAQTYGSSSPQLLSDEVGVDLPEFGSKRARRQAVQYDATRPIYAQHTQSPLEPPADNAVPLSKNELLPIPEVEHNSSFSPAATSEASSPGHSPRTLGSPNDLENFHDLFYKPRASAYEPGFEPETSPPSSPPPTSGSLTWDIANRNRRTGSGLTSLARQLSEEFEQMAERDRTSSQHSYSSASLKNQTSLSRRRTNRSLEFVFEEIHRSSSPLGGDFLSEQTQAFKPSFNLPEDIELSRAPSPVEREEDEDDTAMFRVGMVESVSTPPAVSVDRRRSLTGTMAYSDRQTHSESTKPEGHHLSVFSNLQPPTEATRSSYMTTSTASRMSGLSDFPIPPKDDHFPPAHMSLLASYFDETLTQRDLQALRDTPHPLTPHEGRFTFTSNISNQDASSFADTHPAS